MKIAGRQAEVVLLQSLLKKEESAFVAMYGRRRIGKTYLIRQVFENEIVFECSGVLGKNMPQQLENFWRSLNETNPQAQPPLPPKTWLAAFFQLREYLNRQKQDTKKVIFLDEIPWFETPRSGFLAALDNFWNQYCTKRTDIILVICGSAASWIIDKVINNKGGLHNRLTNQILLMPFTLAETKTFLEMKNVQLTLKDIVQIYMCVGGVPFYLKDIKAGDSVPQILDQLFYNKQAILKNEFQNLYAALFKNNTFHEKVVEALATKNKGLTRNEIIDETDIKGGGGLTTVLEELTQCGFIMPIYPIKKAKEDCLYRLMDEYTLFYFKFLKEGKTKNSWSQITQSQTYKVWSGYAFENLCFKHTFQIKMALGINGIVTNEYSYAVKAKKNKQGIQIDMIIDRADNCVNIIEAKFYNTEYEVSEAYARQLLHKVTIFQEQTSLKKNVFVTLLTVFGAKKNKYFLTAVTNQLLIDDLFT
ncbi:MAG: AAA family ATPase [Ferruginibacter sp.]|nr:AAA family ATPase [Ferruginibacter sp.]